MLHVMGRGRREMRTAIIDLSVDGRIILHRILNIIGCYGLHWVYLPWVGIVDGSCEFGFKH